MTRTFLDFLEDMLDYSQKAIGFVDGLAWEAFETNEMARFATIRAIEVVGEAARHIPSDFQARFQDVPWSRIIGMRNILAHDYFGTNPRVIYDTATIFMPELAA